MIEKKTFLKKIKFFDYLKQYYKNLKISSKLAFLYSLSAAVFIIVLGGYYNINTGNYINKKTAELLGQTLKQAKDNIDYKVNLYNNLADTVYVNVNIQNLLYDEYVHPADKLFPQRNIREYIQPLKTGYSDIDEISLIVKNHTITTFGNSIQSEKAVKDEIWYKKYLDTDEEIYWMSNSSANMILIRKLSHLIYDSYLGLLKIEINADTFFKGLNEVGSKEKGWFDITDKQGRIIYSGIGKLEQDYTDLLQREYSEDFFQPGMNKLLKINDDKFMVLSDNIEYTGWNILFLVPLKEYNQARKNLNFTTVIIVLLCVLIFIRISWFLASHLTEKIRKLSSSMEKIQTGDFDVHIKYSGKDEIGSLINGFNVMAVKLKKMVNEIYAIELKKKQQELQTLQAQINPHFLYNTLSSISWLGSRIGSDDIVKISNSLATFYRLSLSKGKNIIKIKDEIEHVKAYVSIQNISYKNKIKIVYEIDDRVLEIDTPKLILQPFVENALIHGMSKNKNNITIRLIIIESAGEIIWKVIDDGIGIPKSRQKKILDNEEKHEGFGYGIDNVNQRIKLYFGSEYGVKIESWLGMGTTITIKTPWK